MCQVFGTLFCLYVNLSNHKTTHFTNSMNYINRTSNIIYDAATIESLCHQHSSVTLFVYMRHMASQYLRQGKCRTSETYATTLCSFKRYRNGKDLRLQDITSDIVLEYESYLRNKSLSPNTISFYIKHLRAVYNRAVEEGILSDRHPFKRVKTSSSATPKRAVSLKTIKRIKDMELGSSPSRCFARDMFLFSFYTRGMSFVDIATLEKSNLKGSILYYRRKKTNQQLEIRLEKCMLDLISKYRSHPSSPYLLSVIDHELPNPRKQYLSCMSKVNRHLKSIGNELGLQHPLTMYCARHSWASIARDEGIPLSVISEGMGHDSEKTTRIYLASIRSEVIDQANRKILKLLSSPLSTGM